MTVPVVTVRPMRPDDVAPAQRSSFDAFVALDRAQGRAPAEPAEQLLSRGRARVTHLLETDPGGAWVADTDSGIVGTALALRRGSIWFLSLLTVAPAVQGGGIGARLLEAALTTADGAAGAWLCASSDPRALRRYARAGFALVPALQATGRPDRARLATAPDVRDGAWQRDRELVDEVAAALRGAPYGPDQQPWQQSDARLLVVDRPGRRGYAVVRDGQLVALGAHAPATAQQLLRAFLAEAPGEVTTEHVTAEQGWAVDVLLDAGLSLAPGDPLCRRGRLGPMTPYLPSGAYG